MAWSKDELAENPHANAQKASHVRGMFGAIAGSYDLNNRLHAFGLDQHWRRSLIRHLAIGPDDRVLDVACGTGDLTQAAADAGAATVLGVDFTPEMLVLARAKAADKAANETSKTATNTDHVQSDVPPSRVKCCTPTYAPGDATALDLPDGGFDVVTIAFGIRNVDDIEAALSEFHRVLAPGGRLGILEFSEPRNRVIRLLNVLYTRHIMPLSATLIARDRTGAYRYLPRSVATFHTPESLAVLLKKHGFVVDRQIPMTFGACTGTVARRLH